VIDALSFAELDEVMKEVTIFKQTDLDYKEYWTAVWNLLEVQKKAITNRREDDGAMHPAILDDVKALLEGRSTEELLKLELVIKQSLTSGYIIDEDYWHSVVLKLTIYKARSKVNEFHQQLVRDRCRQLQKQKGLSEDELKDIEQLFLRSEVVTEKKPTLNLAEMVNAEKKEREPIQKPRAATSGRYWSDAEMMKMEEEKGETDEEARFTREVEMEEGGVGQKPLYYNRERKGVDWTKHNQAMFTEDNPPPPTTLGYEFNIFYPDLLDKTKTPSYQLIPTENPDLRIIVFKASAPYKDLAFKIAAIEWECSQKKGFRCVFSNGIFHLHFWFKRYRYRR
jgi:PHD/YefM family antitoxin component YafN of YafNO toxin-antitoxin module